MTRTLVHTDNAPAAVGPYSQAIRVGDFLYTSGQIAIDPSVGAMIDGDVTAQTEQVLRNLREVLEAGGSSMERVIKTTVFMTTMDHYKAINVVYGEHFATGRPARSAVAVSQLPLGALVEIEAVAYCGA